ncbi:peptidase [Gardnerella vaginalis]|uniref:peptidase n=1 Tax=Gardnerella vaginalis TaxID=2702 RepID=UPI003369F7C9
MTTKSAKHADKTFGSAKDKSAKTVDIRKVAALSAGAAGVIAGAAIAFGATPAMAAEANVAPVNTNDSAKEQNLVDANKGNSKTSDDSKATKKNEASKDETPNSEVKKEAKKEESKEAKEEPKKEQTKPAEQAVAKTDGNTDVTKTEARSKVESIASVDNQDAKQDTAENSTPAENVAKSRKKRDLSAENQKQGEPVVGTDREANPEPSVSNQINISEDTKNSVPNMYAWGSSNNTYIKSGQSNTVTFNFAKPKDGYNISSIAIFPAQNNSMTTDKGRNAAEYYSGNTGLHQSYSGEYTFTPNTDGSAKLEMTPLFRDGNLNSGVAYAANRCIYVYGKKDGGDEVLLYKTNIARAATLIPPKTAGSIVLKYNEELTAQQIREKLQKAIDAPTEATGNKSIREQIQAASTSKGVGGNTGANGAFVQTPDTAENKVIINAQRVYIPTDVINFNRTTSKPGDTETTYTPMVRTLKTHLITDTGYTSDDLPLTVARYDTRIDKPVVDEVDIKKLTDDQKADICKKLAQLNHVTQDKVKFNDQGQAVISFDGVDENDAPKIDLKDLVLKNLKAGEYAVPSDDEGSTTKAVIISNPLGFTTAEEDAIKKAIYEANKGNNALGLSDTDYANQITLDWNRGNLQASGTGNQGISNGDSENTIHVTIKTDKAIAKFDSDVKHNKLTRLVNLRTDYTLSWEANKNKIDGRASDEGLAWMEDGKTLVYRYDSDSGKTFNTEDVLGLLKATIKEDLKKDNPQMRTELLGSEYKTVAHEGQGGKDPRSHTGYAVDDKGNPIGVLNLSKLNGSSYGRFSQPVSNSDKKMGDEQASAGDFTFDADSKTVKIAGKKDKYMLGRLFIEPYSQYHYNNIYGEGKYNLRNNPKGINIVFMPQTKHKTKDLKDSIGEHKTETVEGKDIPTESKYYNASDAKKKAYDDALKVAQDTLTKVGNTTDDKLSEQLKAEVDNATINLNKARAELDGADTNKDKLNASIEADGTPAEGQQATTGTKASDKYKNVTNPDFKTPEGKTDEARNNAAKAAKKAYDDALAEANKLKDDANATQKAVDEAKAKLDAAREKLNEFSTNKDELNNAIAQHGKVNTGDAKKTDPTEKLKTADPTYQNSTPEQRKAYDDAVKKAGEVVADPNASQKEVNEAIKKLKEAKDALDKNATNKAPLDAAVQKTLDNPDPKDPNKHSVFYTNAAAKKDTDAAAKKAVEDYDKALAEAKRVLGDKNATKADVDKAKKDLEDAEKVLYAETYQTKATDLAQALVDNFSGYLMPAYFNAFDEAQAKGKDSQAAKDFKDYNDAYHAAKDLMDELKKPGSTVDQKKVDAAKDKLVEARKAIDKYATDTSKISAALLHSLAIKASPAYKNASATDATEDAKNAAKAYDDALKELQKAFNDNMDKDKGDDGSEIPESVIPDKNIDMTNKDALKKLQAHAKGQPLNRDVTKLLAKLNDAVKGLDKFKTNTDELLKSVNEDAATHQNPAYKNASQPDYKQGDGTTADTTKNDAAKKAVDDYGDALNAAKDLLKNPAATQKEVNDALQKLNEKRKALDTYKTDTTKLKESVKKHGDTEGTAPTEGTQTSDAYRNASNPHFMKEQDGKLVPDTDKNTKAAAAKKAYDEALTKAQELLKKHGDANTPQDAKPTQKDINDALDALDKARKNLDDYKTDTTKLDAEAQKSQAADATAPTAGQFEDSPEFKNASYKQNVKPDTDPDVQQAKSDIEAYKKALKDARDLLAKKDSDTLSERPTQKQIDDALETLKKAKQAITDGYKTDTSKLTEAKEYANGDFKKTPEYKNAEAIKADANNANHEQAGKDLDGTDENPGLTKLVEKITQKLQNAGNLTQREVDTLLKQLKGAQKKIAENYKTNADKLKNEVGDKDQDGKPVTPKFEESIPYKNALYKKQSETGDAATGKDSATKKLETYNEKLKAAQDLINKVNHPDPNAAPDTKPTQKQVDDALAALKQAKKAIDDTFTTKVDALKKETKELKDDGGEKEDKYKFENSTEYKNALAKTDADGKKDVQTYQDALKKANDLLGKFDENGKPKPGEKDIPSQKEVDDALKNLKEIKDKITKNYVTSPHDLQQEVDKSKDGKDDTSTDVFENTPEFKNATAKGDDAAKKALDEYNEKLKAAKGLLDAFDRTTGKPKDQLPQGMDKAPTQKELDDALDALKAVKKKITDGYKTDSSKLKSEADANDTFTKTPEYQNAQAKGDDASKNALDAYKKALEDANKVLGDKNATQAQVDAALKKLQDAKSKLSDGYKTDKTDLTAEAGKDSDFTKSPEYQNAAGSPEAEAYKKALDEANSVLDDPNATQAQVDEALRKLQDAKKKLADSHKTDKSDLNTEAGKDSDFRKSIPFIIGKAADLAEYQQALNDANSVLKDPNATQAQVDQALRRLRAAKQKLIDSYNRLINSGSGVGSGSDHDFGTDTDVNTGVGVNDSNTTSVNNVVDKSVLQAEVDQALGDVSANANGVVADSSLVSEFNAALNYARLVLADANATQGQVDSALARLRAARAALRDGMLAARNSAGMNLKRGDVSGVNTGASSSVFAAFAAVFAGLGVAGAASKRRRHSAR